MNKDARSIRVSSYVEMSIAIKLNSLAEKKKISISDFLREIIIASIEKEKENERV